MIKDCPSIGNGYGCSLTSLHEETDFAVTIEIVESDSLEKRLDDFASVTGEAVFRYTSIAESVMKDMKSENYFIEYWRWKRALAALDCIRRESERLEEFARKEAEMDEEGTRFKGEVQEFFDGLSPEEKEVAREIWRETGNVD